MRTPQTALAPPPFTAPSFTSISASSLQPRVWVFVLTAKALLVWKPFLHLALEFKLQNYWTQNSRRAAGYNFSTVTFLTFVCLTFFGEFKSIFPAFFFLPWVLRLNFFRQARAALCVFRCLRNREWRIRLVLESALLARARESVRLPRFGF